MKYVMSDIHGDLKSLKCLIDKTNMNLDSEDVLYIAGDLIDRGTDSLGVLKYLAPWIKKGTVIVIKGNHEAFCQHYLENKLSAERWALFGGAYTLQNVNQLTQKEKDMFLGFLRDLPYYVELDLGKIIITHSGVSSDWLVYNKHNQIDVVASIELGVEMMGEFSFLIQEDIHFLPQRQKERLDKFIICGHKPTFRLHEEKTVFFTPFYMDIDCGAGYRDQGGKLACYCIDTDEVLYV